MRRLVSASFVALSLAMFPASAAAVDVIPPEVVAAFDQGAVTRAENLSTTGVPSLAGVDGHGPIHQVNSFSDAFLRGLEGDPLAPQDSWVANLMKGSEPVGQITYGRDQGEVRYLGAGGDVDHAKGVAQIEGSYVYLEEYAAQFDLRGDTLVALNPEALDLAGASEQSLAAAQRSISARFKADLASKAARPSSSRPPEPPAVSGESPGEVPPEVVAAFEKEALTMAKILADSGVPTVVGVDGYGPIHQVHMFSNAFHRGLEGPPLVPLQEWAATLVKGSEPVGVIMFWRYEGEIEFSAAGGDPDECRGLAQVEGTYIREERYASQFDLRGGDTLVAVDKRALALVGDREQSLASAQKLIAAQFKADVEYASAHPNAVGGGAGVGEVAVPDAEEALAWAMPLAIVALLGGIVAIMRSRAGN